MLKIKDEAQAAIVYIYGTIGEDSWGDEGNSAKEFAQLLDTLSPKPLEIRIDSPGGDVYEGFAIASAIMRYEGPTHAYIDGMAASAASYIALMADRVTMNEYSMLMVHNAWCLAVGNRDELRETADRLEALDGTIAGIIEARSALTLDEVRAAMTAETWYGADDALLAGMVDEVIETDQKIAACIDRTLASRYHNIPETVTLVDGRNPKPPAEEPVDEIPEETAEEIPEEPADELELPEEPEHGIKQGCVLLGNRVYRQ